MENNSLTAEYENRANAIEADPYGYVIQTLADLGVEPVIPIVEDEIFQTQSEALAAMDEQLERIRGYQYLLYIFRNIRDDFPADRELIELRTLLPVLKGLSGLYDFDTATLTGLYLRYVIAADSYRNMIDAGGAVDLDLTDYEIGPLSHIEVKGFVAGKHKTKLVVSNEDIYAWLSVFPPVMLEKLVSIEKDNYLPFFRSVYENGQIFDFFSSLSYELGSGAEFLSCGIKINLAHTAYDQVREEKLELIRNGIQNALYHQVFHMIHFNLTVQEMANWMEIGGEDFEILRGGRKERKKKDAFNRDRMIIENLAEAGRMFLKNPKELYRQSELAFNYMLNLWSKYLKPDDAQRFIQQKMAEVA